MTKNDLGLREKFLSLESELNGEIFERQDEIHSALLALISHSHHFQYGTPGVGKSFLVDRLVPRIEGLEGDAYFKWLLTKFSTPEELFGGPNLKLFKEEGIYKRITAKKLPVATVSMLDEIFKANSAILNALLKILNERQFDNCDEDPHIPLTTIFGASNEIPSSKELEALSDRLHLWHHVKPMQEPSNFVKMLQLELDPNPPKILSLEDLEEAHGAASEVAVQDHIYEIFVDLQAELRTADIMVTDRRFHQSIDVIKAEAWLNNHEVAEVFDMKPLMHMLWKDPAHIDTVRSIVLGLVDPLEKQINDLSDNYRKAISEWERSLLDSDTAPMRTEATMQMYDKFTKAKKELAEYKESEKSTGRYCRSLHEFEGYLKSTALQIRTELGIDD